MGLGLLLHHWAFFHSDSTRSGGRLVIEAERQLPLLGYKPHRLGEREVHRHRRVIRDAIGNRFVQLAHCDWEVRSEPVACPGRRGSSIKGLTKNQSSLNLPTSPP